jgi:hypothetical protein
VKVKSTTLFGAKQIIIKETNRPITPFGGLFVFTEYLKKTGFVRKASELFPFHYTSPNAINATETFTYFLLTVLCGARRFTHTLMIKADDSLRIMTGMKRFPNDDTIRNMFKRFGMKQNYEFFGNLSRWLISRLKVLESGHTIDLDSTVFVRYGNQEGSRKGYNPEKHGRNSHHPLIAVLAEANYILNGWLRSGNTGSSSSAVDFMKETLCMCKDVAVRIVRADTGFFCDKFLSFLESCNLIYIVAAKMTKNVKNVCYGIRNWISIDEIYSVGEIEASLFGWKTSRRFIVIRELIQESKESIGKYLMFRAIPSGYLLLTQMLRV